MTKRILVVALLAPMLMLAKPTPASAHVGVSVAIGLPFFGAVVGVPGPYYAPPVYPVPIYAPPVYAPAPVYVAPPVYAPVYVRPRPFVPVFRAHFGPRFARHRFHHW